MVIRSESMGWYRRGLVGDDGLRAIATRHHGIRKVLEDGVATATLRTDCTCHYTIRCPGLLLTAVHCTMRACHQSATHTITRINSSQTPKLSFPLILFVAAPIPVIKPICPDAYCSGIQLNPRAPRSTYGSFDPSYSGSLTYR